MSITCSSVAMAVINECNFISYGFMPLSWLIFKSNDNNTLIYLCLYLKVISQRILEDEINTIFDFKYCILETGWRVIGRKQKFSNILLYAVYYRMLQGCSGLDWNWTVGSKVARGIYRQTQRLCDYMLYYQQKQMKKGSQRNSLFNAMWE